MADTSPLFEPLSVRGLSLPNRIVMSPMTRNFSTDGVPGEDVAAYYKRRAEAEVGLIITEGVGVDHPSALGEAGMGKRQADIPFMYGEAALAGWRRVVEAVRGAGGLIIPQLWHMGGFRLQGTGPYPEAMSIRPSGFWGPVGRHTSTPAAFIAKVSEPLPAPTDETVQDLVDGYVRSTAAAMSVGFDGIAVHGAHGYLIDTFFWAETNQRDDRWGGDMARRAEFAVQIIKGLRREVGPDRPVIFRYSQWKQHDYLARLGETPDDLAAFLEPLVEAGVDVFDVSTRNFDRPAFEGSELSQAGWTRKLTGVTTMAVGGVGVARDGQIFTVDNLDRVLARFEAGEFDLIAVGRALLSDPQFARKARTGEAFIPFNAEAYDVLV
ncbi:MAG: 12-oxophytodienoate reductase [Caulobacter sp.]|nr:12-oxophytodienoate reductase [Caulobacter sp.]